MKLPMLSAADKHAEIRRLYFKTTRQTIQADLEKALDLLKSMASEEAYYWFSKATDHHLGRRSQKAMRILLAKE